MPRYMVIENYHAGCLDKIYQRFYKNGRMMPEGLHFIESWLEKSGARCFQLMETDDPLLFDIWIKNWDDLVSFEIIEIGKKPSSDDYKE